MAKRKAPPGCYWRGDALWGRAKGNGREVRWSLHTGDPTVARARRKAGEYRLSAGADQCDSPRTVVEALEGWETWIGRKVGARTAQRYACSLDQLRPFLDGKLLTDINGWLVAEIIRS